MVNKKILIAVFIISIAGVALASHLLFNLLPRDHTEISCTRPLQIGIKTFEFSTRNVIFKVYDENTNTLLWTSPQYTIQRPFVDILLNTSITNPPSLIRVEMIRANTNTILSKILLEPDCDLVVAAPTFIFPPPNGCKLIINPPSSTTTTLPSSGGGSGGGHTSEGFPTAAVAVDLSKDIGKTATVVVRDKDGNTLAQSAPMTIDTEILSMNLVSVAPIPVDSFFDITYELKIDGIPKTKAKCTVINGAALESLFPTTTTTTTTTTTSTVPGCFTSAQCNDNDPCTQDLCSSGVCSNPPAPNGQACDDNLYCTVSDVCVNGDCSGGQQRSCDDSNICTQDSCNEVSDICSNVPVQDATPTGSTCGTGACQRSGVCISGVATCTPGSPSAETCDNIDNDCDGSTDESLAQSCYTGPSGTSGVGECNAGTQTCTSGVWGSCIGEVTPSSELCNGVDDDCDGVVDDNCV